MILNLSNKLELNKAKTRFNHLVNLGKTIELKALSDNRSSQQNRALHKFFVLISSELNELGLEFQYFGLKGQVLSTRYTSTIVKNHFWRPIQISLFNIESTKDINTKEMNDITDVIVKYFGDKGVYIEFPNKDILSKD